MKKHTYHSFLPERLPDEPVRWYDRFCLYCLAGAPRSLEGTWRAVTKSSKKQRMPGDWHPIFQRWNWRARAREFDDKEFSRRARVVEQERREERRLRRKRAGALGAKIDKFLEDDSPGSIAALARLAPVYFSASREDFGSTSSDLVSVRTEDISSAELKQILKQTGVE